jgi:hypothetical protein
MAGCAASSTRGEHVTVSDSSAAVSRKVMNTSDAPGRREIWAT